MSSAKPTPSDLAGSGCTEKEAFRYESAGRAGPLDAERILLECLLRHRLRFGRSGSEGPSIEILAVAGGQRFGFDDTKRALPVAVTLCSQGPLPCWRLPDDTVPRR